MTAEEHERFFRGMLGDIDEPTMPFGLGDVHGGGDDVAEAHRALPQSLNDRLRAQARRLGVSLASLCHLAWGQVVGRTSGREQVVFGTVLFGRMQAGAGSDQAMGLFINTLPLRLDLDGTGVEDSVRRVHGLLAELLRYEHASLALAQRCSGVAAPAPLFSALLNYRHNTLVTAQGPSVLDGIEWLGAEGRTNYPLSLSVEDDGQSLGLTAQALQPLSADRINGFMQRALEQLAEALEQRPQMPVRQLDILPSEERSLVLEEWNRTDAAYPADRCIHELFEAQAARTPDAVALVYEEQTLSYGALNERANRLARHLVGLGVKPDDRVAICVERSLEMVVGLLAILKAGGAYVPLDPGYPPERLAFMLADSAPVAVLSDGKVRTVLADLMAQAAATRLPVIDLTEAVASWADLPASNLDAHALGLTSSHLAYVIYTSGSTGTPKGVMVEHRNLMNYVCWAYGAYDPVDAAVSSSLSFDATITSLYLPLIHGGKIYLIPEKQEIDGLEARIRVGCGLVKITPAHLEALGQRAVAGGKGANVAVFVIGGEALPRSVIELWRTIQPSARMVNEYGPTETVVGCTIYEVDKDIESASVPIGRPISNTRIYLLDGYGQPVPIGVAGELYIGGAGVARGYLNRPELTAARFLADPFVGELGRRMYRTGDLARYLPDGNIEYLGRNDHQVKIRGFRIELGEIEARLGEHRLVREAVVLAREDEPGDKRLVAYVTAPDVRDADGFAAELREHLALRLPQYMVPSAFVRLDRMPLTPNGKLDRKALEAPEGDAYARRAYEAPRGEIEQMLAQAWAELLGVERVGRHDNFFELGGHSLLAVRLIARLRRVGLGVEVRTLFATPDLAGLAAGLGNHRDVVVPANAISMAITPAMLPLIELTQSDIDAIVARVPGGIGNIQDIYGLSPLQDGILFHHLLAEEGDPYLIRSQMVFADRGLLDRYLAAVQRVVDRHDILRTGFMWEGLSNAAQIVLRRSPLLVSEVELDGGGGPVQEQLARRFDPRHHRIDLGQAPLLRFAIARDGDGERWHVVQLLHHLIGDNTAMETLHGEVRAFLSGTGDALEPAQPFRDLVAHARLGVTAEEHERFFRGMLGDIDEPTMPFGLGDVHGGGDDVAEAHRALPQSLNDRLRAQARRLGVSLASLCHLAWGQVVGRTSGREQVVFGTVLFGRMQAGAGSDQAMGLFINTLPLRLDLDGTGVEDSVRRVHGLLAELLRYEHASLALAQRCSGVAAPAPLFSALLNYRHNTLVTAQGPSVLDGIEWLGAEGRTNYPLSLSVEDDGQSLGLTAQALQPLSADRINGFMQRALEQLAEALEQRPQMPVRQLDILPSEERSLVLEEWNRTDAAYPADRCIHELFEAQAARTPDAVALVYEEQTLSYGALNERANRLARHLVGLGVKPDDRVAICVERSLEMVVGLLAILKAGGAYVPLDPGYPPERLAFMLADSAPVAVLSDGKVRTVLADLMAQAAATRLPVIDLTEAVASWADLPASNLDAHALGLTSSHLAYVIYTSGSTGTPKGVMVEHRNVVNHTIWQIGQFDFNADDAFLQRTSPAFDAAGWEFWTPLSLGARLVLLPSALQRDPQGTLAVANSHGITVMQMVPSFLSSLHMSGASTGRSVRYLFCGGEPLSYDLIVRSQEFEWRKLVNLYGPTEATIDAITWTCPQHFAGTIVPIGRPISNTRIYLLDGYGQPVPIGVAGELYIGGAGVARGYLNRPELTAARFLADPFVGELGRRMYRTGDLARYLPDGNIEYLGRNDHQVKIRGFRIELGEIEARLGEHRLVREAVVLAREDEPGDKRLVAYVTAPDVRDADGFAAELREHLALRLPQYMVPSAFVRLDRMPLTPNGKLDRKALEAPEGDAYARRAYEAPRGEIEQMLAQAWAELLGVERVGRHDNFFELGGHSLLAVRLIARLRRVGLGVEVRTLFATPDLAGLAAGLGNHRDVVVPANAISMAITPAMLPLIELTQSDIDAIVARVPGGIGNIQDIYGLSPLQDGILFHHLLAEEGDPYLIRSQMVFADRGLLDRYLAAVQRVVDRHDILRTGFMWEGLSNAAQIVLRRSPLLVSEVELDGGGGPVQEQLARRFDPRHHRIDLGQAPLLRFAIARDGDGERWHVVQLLHHLIGDNTAMETLHGEVRAFLSGTGDALEPAQPFRDLVAHARLGVTAEEHERFFRGMLGDIDEPTMPFGLGDVHGGGDDVAEAHRALPQSLNDRLRAQARRLGVSLASLCHLAWGQVVGRTSGREQVVFGTVLFGRMQAGAGSDQAMGLFINTLPLRLDLDGTGVEDSVRRVHGLLAELLRYEHASLALAQRCSGVAAPAPLFSALLNYRHNTLVTAQGPSVLDGIEWLGAEGRTNYPLSLSVEDDGQSLGLTAQALQPLSADRINGFMQRALEQLAEALEQRPQMPVRQLDILPSEERSLVLEEWNRTDAAYPADRCIHELFEAQAARTPDAVALVYEEQTLSYGALNERANRLARHLVGLGVKPDDRVAICVERSLEMVVGLLAILKAGGAYVPLDPGYPPERLAFMLADSAPVAVLSDGKVRTVLADLMAQAAATRLPVIDLTEAVASWADLPASNLDAHALGLTSSHLAYVIYTSGSTGTPKGVMVEHRNLMNYVCWAYGAYDPVDAAVSSSLSFDATITSLYLPLIHGGKIYLIPEKQEIDGLEARIRVGCGLVKITPAHLEALGQRAVAGGKGANVAVFVIGGEALPRSVIELWRTIQPSARMVNEYGPTETVVGCTIYEVDKDIESASVPIGRPISNTRIYLLDGYGQPVPIGVAGELYIGGAGVARGYLNRPELTAARFLADPFVGELGRRMYRTGDLARYLPDGNIEYLGRNDHQVKIRGFRIELGEIEARLGEHRLVREAVVLAREDEPGDKRLVAYVTAPDVRDADGFAAELREHLALRLPQYMVPSAFVRLDRMPLTPNGKLDRKALEAPEGDAYARRAYEAPRGEIEQMLAQAWAELLGVERVGRHDNFFELGGHSLLAVRLIARLRRVGLGVEVRTLFATPDLAGLAAGLGNHRDVVVPANAIGAGSMAITPAMLPLIELTQSDIDAIVARVPGGIGNIQDIYGLSPLQDGILFHHLLAEEGDPYLIRSQMVFADRGLLDRYLAAVQRVVDRHDILRTGFMWEGLSNAAQIVLRRSPLLVSEVELDGGGGPVQEQLARRFDPRHHRIDLGQAPLLRFAIARDGDGERWHVVQLLHHLIGDNTAMETLHGEVRAFLSGTGDALEPAQPFRDLVAHARLGVTAEEHERFFRGMLGDIDEPTMPFGLGDVHGGGDDVAEAHRALPQSLNDRLRAQARRLGVSLASLCHLAWGQVVGRTSGREQVVFGTVLFGRMQAGAGSDQAMGLFINTLPLRLDLDGTGVEDSVRRVHGLLAELLRYEHASLALAQRCSGVAAPAPLFSALLNYRHNTLVTAQGPSVLDGIEWLGAEGRTNYPLSLSVEDDGQSLGLTAQALQPLSADRINGFMQRALEQLAEALEQRPQMPVRQLDILPSEERSLVLEEWNRTDAAYPADRCIHELFEAQAARTPDAVALVYEEQTLSYGALNERANRLARHLVGLGVKPDDRVAICVERSLEMVVGLLAILKAGGAYVPLDPGYPPERLAFMLADSAPVAVLSDGKVRTVLADLMAQAAATRLPVIDLTEAVASWADLPASNLDAHALGLTSSHLAYVIYTSGSTGTPKGVMVEHRNVQRLFGATDAWFGFGASDVWSLFHSYAFDFSVWETWGALLHGGRLIVVPYLVSRSPEAFLKLLVEEGVTVLNQTPSAFYQLIRADEDHPGIGDRLALRCVVFGGEALELRRLEPWYKRHSEAAPLLVNMYGITETTVHVSYLALDRELAAATHSSLVGRGIPDLRVYVLDDRLNPVPPGVPGELYVSGAGVARGYLNRPELTTERFVADPFVDEPRQRMYRTGDLARWRTDGVLEYLGRNDHQVKIRGFRIELGEIEARLGEHRLVREAVVLAREDEPGDKRLVAYVTAPDVRDADGFAAELREHLALRLPQYMVPSAFVRLDRMPLTPNGKLDRKALEAPEGDAYARRAYEAPRGEIEQMLAQAWAELLGVERVGRHDNFFELGGHSLLATRLTSRARSLGIRLSIRSLFEAPTVAGLAAKLSEGSEDSAFSVILPIRKTGSYPALFCLPPGGGLSWGYGGLIKHIPKEVPIFGLQSRGLSESDSVETSMEDMVQDHLAQIRRVQAVGPYNLLGWSFGGYLAYEIAVALRRSGEAVSSLTLLDTFPLTEYTKSMVENPEKVLLDKFLGTYQVDTDTNKSERKQLKELLMVQYPAFFDIGDDQLERVISVTKSNIRALSRFSLSRYDGDINLMVASLEASAPAADVWSSYVNGKIYRHDISCFHGEMTSPHAIASIGAAMSRYILAVPRGQTNS